MRVSKSLTKVTPLSKTLALVIFTTLPILGFFLGIYFQQSRQIEPELQQNLVKASSTDNPKSLISRCGDIPDKAYPTNTNHFDVVKGPVWSPDCRHIAWSLWESGTSYPTEDSTTEIDTRKLSGREGVFVYSDTNKTIKKIYNPFKLDESPTFVEWQNRENLVFTANNSKYKYNLPTKEILPL